MPGNIQLFFEQEYIAKVTLKAEISIHPSRFLMNLEFDQNVLFNFTKYKGNNEQCFLKCDVKTGRPQSWGKCSD